MTGKRLLQQILHWDYIDCRPSNWKVTQCRATKKWSKYVRQHLNKDLHNKLIE